MHTSVGPVSLSKMDLDTPALLVDLDLMAENMARIADTCRRGGVAWRPHMKGIKIPAIAHMARAAGAIGITCAKLGEAEVMASAGIDNILIANEIVGRPKAARLAGLQHHANVMVLVDSQYHVAELGSAAREAGVIQGVLIEVNLGLGRAGVSPGREAITLAGQIAAEGGLKLVGVAGWEGHTIEIVDQNEKANAVKIAVDLLISTAQALREVGYCIDIVSCGGTGTYMFTSALNGVTEVQAGGGIFSDVRYRTKFHVDHPYSLTLISTITSRPNDSRIICDAGMKTMSNEGANPIPIGIEGVRSVALSAEHVTIELDVPNRSATVGTKLEFVVGYSDTTVHLHDELFGVRDGKVEIVWPVLGRGKSR